MREVLFQAVTSQPAMCSPWYFSQLHWHAGTCRDTNPTPSPGVLCALQQPSRAPGRAKLRLQKRPEVQRNPELLQQHGKQCPRAPPAKPLAGCWCSQKALRAAAWKRETTLAQLLQGRLSPQPIIPEQLLLPLPAHGWAFHAASCDCNTMTCSVLKLSKQLNHFPNQVLTWEKMQRQFNGGKEGGGGEKEEHCRHAVI